MCADCLTTPSGTGDDCSLNLHCVAMCCTVLNCVALCCTVVQSLNLSVMISRHQRHFPFQSALPPPLVSYLHLLASHSNFHHNGSVFLKVSHSHSFFSCSVCINLRFGITQGISQSPPDLTNNSESTRFVKYQITTECFLTQFCTILILY